MPSHRRPGIIAFLPLAALLVAATALADEAPADALAKSPEVDVAPEATELPPTTGAVSVTSLLELDVVDAKGEDLGGVYDLVADPAEGTLKFLVIERSGEILGLDVGIGAERVAIPWHRVKMEEAPRRFHVDLTREAVDNLPDWEGARTEGGLVGAAPAEGAKEGN